MDTGYTSEDFSDDAVLFKEVQDDFADNIQEHLIQKFCNPGTNIYFYNEGAYIFDRYDLIELINKKQKTIVNIIVKLFDKNIFQ